jgi:LAO/AO transport system kinase
VIDGEFVAAVRQGDAPAVARAITRVERGGQDARDLVRALFASGGRAHIVGVTGAPGTGKSTLVNVLAKDLTARGYRVAIIAVDPSSPFTGGALLGDRLRMQDLSGTGVFIRSMASRGELGGLAAAVADALVVLDAAGFDILLVETVGAGQGEVEIARQAHTTVVLEAPGMGDEIQAIKAGILEIADVLVVNKADRDGANATVAALEMNLSLNSVPQDWRPPVLKTVALTGEGVAELADTIGAHRTYLERNGRREEKEAARVNEQLRGLVQSALLEQAQADLAPGRWKAVVNAVRERKIDIYSAAEAILADSSGFQERVV